MRRTLLMGWISVLVIAATIWFPKVVCAQEGQKDQRPSEPAKASKPVFVYRLEFVVRELEDKKQLNSRSYTMLVTTGDWARLRVGNRVPYSTGKDQYQYFDVGMNIDCLPQERENLLLLDMLTIDITSVVKNETAGGGTPNPVVRQARSSISTVLPPGKPTVVTTLDDVSSNHRYEVEVTATKVR